MSNQAFGDAKATLSDEMQAYDLLGPQSRAAIASARFQIGAASLVAALRACGLEPSDPAADRAGATAVRHTDAEMSSSLRFAPGDAAHCSARATGERG